MTRFMKKLGIRLLLVGVALFMLSMSFVAPILFIVSVPMSLALIVLVIFGQVNEEWL